MLETVIGMMTATLTLNYILLDMRQVMADRLAMTRKDNV